MYIDLSGEWHITLIADEGEQSGEIALPGTLQAAGYGNPVTRKTPWVSTLHDSFWYEQEEYKYAQDEQVNVPFLSQPARHFMGVASYDRSFVVPDRAVGSDESVPRDKSLNAEGLSHAADDSGCGEESREWHFHVELARWKSRVYIDGTEVGGDCSLCGPHDVRVGRLSPGKHTIKVELDNSQIYPYRPDAHGVSDALGATWNGMAGEIALLTADEVSARIQARRRYANENKRTVEVRDGRFVIDGNPVYFRATHMGGEYPLTGYPVVDERWWRRIMKIIREWGLNGIRFHSYCPPEAAFAAADEEDIYLLVECGMWNHFEDTESGQEMLGVLKSETRKILENFGHHPSFVFFSPSNEPGGRWHKPLRRWVEETRDYDDKLGYAGRRVYTAESGWHYDVAPAEIEGTDFIYFHRSGYGPYSGGTIRNPQGWNGRDYSPSLEGVKKPVVCHELGQFCAYPNYDVIDKFTGFMQPGNYKVFRECARANGILPYAEKFVKCSGENQLRLYKEDMEANFRTPEIQGFELLDLHDYLGQGTAVVGILDAFWENKGYGNPAEFREHCNDTVLLARFPSYVWKRTDRPSIPVEICHYGRRELENAVITWTLSDGEGTKITGEIPAGRIDRGGNTKLGEVTLDFGAFGMGEEAKRKCGGEKLTFGLHLQDGELEVTNHWTVYVFERQEELDRGAQSFFYTRDWTQAREALEAGRKVVFNPYLSELNFECSALSARTVGWNAQMGPTWSRTMGIVVQEDHPIFQYFPTDMAGGWQWEDILRQSRGFHMKGMEQISPIVQPIDDWNRNLLQGLLFEARVLNGSLLVVSANLEGKFEERPGAYALRQAIFKYAASEAFAPAVRADVGAIESKFFPVLRMRELTKEVLYEEQAQVRAGGNLVEPDPGASVRLIQDDFPAVITMVLKREVEMRGFLYVPEQRDRDHAGFAKDYKLEVRCASGRWLQASEGTFLNTCRSQEILFCETMCGDALRLTVFSAYGCEEKDVYRETAKGWFKERIPMRAILQIAGIHVLCDEDAPRGDDYATAGEQKSRTREIEL